MTRWKRWATAGILVAAVPISAGPVFVQAQSIEQRCAVAGMEAPLDSEEQAALDAINAYRGRAGLPPVSLSRSLMQSARWKARDLAGGAPFSHDDGFRTWSRRITDCGYSDYWAAENIAGGFPQGEEVVRQWINSGPHRDNLLRRDMQVAGIARAPGGVYGWYWALNLGAIVDEPFIAVPPPTVVTPVDETVN